MAGKTKYPNSAGEVPKQPHWAILKTGRHSDYDGCPSNHITYEAFFDKQEWETEIQRIEQAKNPTDYIALEVRPARVERKVIVDVK